MRIANIIALAGLGFAIGGQALAQQTPGTPFTPQQLDQQSQERMNATGPRNWGPPPPQSSIPPEKLTQPDEMLVCMSSDPWKPVYSQPSSSGAVIGKTLLEVAVKGETVNGFVPILFGPGKTGYVPATEVRPFQSTIKPGLACSIAGLRPNGAAVFDIH